MRAKVNQPTGLLWRQRAVGLMDTLSDEWDPTEFRDTYTEVLRQVIEAKVKGKEIVAPEMPKRERVTNLMDSLQKSLRERPAAGQGRQPEGGSAETGSGAAEGGVARVSRSLGAALRPASLAASDPRDPSSPFASPSTRSA